jgi:hypothetical protein
VTYDVAAARDVDVRTVPRERAGGLGRWQRQSPEVRSAVPEQKVSERIGHIRYRLRMCEEGRSVLACETGGLSAGDSIQVGMLSLQPVNHPKGLRNANRNRRTDQHPETHPASSSSGGAHGSCPQHDLSLPEELRLSQALPPWTPNPWVGWNPRSTRGSMNA